MTHLISRNSFVVGNRHASKLDLIKSLRAKTKDKFNSPLIDRIQQPKESDFAQHPIKKVNEGVIAKATQADVTMQASRLIKTLAYTWIYLIYKQATKAFVHVHTSLRGQHIRSKMAVSKAYRTLADTAARPESQRAHRIA
jgi:hypothetical protein